MNEVMKNRLTEKQYKDIKSLAVQETAENIANMKLEKFIEKFILVMRKNRISKKRIDKMIEQFRKVI